MAGEKLVCHDGSPKSNRPDPRGREPGDVAADEAARRVDCQFFMQVQLADGVSGIVATKVV